MQVFKLSLWMGFVQTMPKALQIDRAVDSNLKPVKDSDGTMTALEVSIDKVRVKDLEVLGTATGITHTDATKHPLTTVGIADDNLVEIDDADAANNDYAKFTANGLEGRSYSEVLSDLGVEANADVTDATNVTAAGALMDSELAGIAAVKATTGTFLSADETKLDGIEASADVTDTTNVTSAGALMDSEVTNLADVKAFDTGDYATAAQGTLATNALPKGGGAMTGAITTNSTFDGVDIATRDGILTSTTTTANAALPKAGGTMTGDLNASDNAIGFTQFEPTYNASDTNVNFNDYGNKAFCTFGAGNITDMNLYFPDVSCNCVLLLKQDGSGSRTVTNWKTFDQADGNESTVVWSGGSNPTLTTTASKLDILSFYWDNDNHKVYGVASLNF